MLNKVMIIGRLGRDPELRYTQSGSPVATLNVATDESYMDRDGNKVERTEWHRVSVFQRQAENCANFLTKGSLVYVEGSLQTRKWQDQNGQDRYTTEIKAQRVQFLDRRSDGPRADMGGYEDDYGAPAPAPRAPRGGNMGGGQRQAPRRERNVRAGHRSVPLRNSVVNAGSYSLLRSYCAAKKSPTTMSAVLVMPAARVLSASVPTVQCTIFCSGHVAL